MYSVTWDITFLFFPVLSRSTVDKNIIFTYRSHFPCPHWSVFSTDELKAETSRARASVQWDRAVLVVET